MQDRPSRSQRGRTKRKLNLPPNVVPHRSKFRGQVRRDGRVFRSPAYATPEQASEWVARFAQVEKVHAAGGPITLGQAMQLVRDAMLADGVREGTRRFAEDKFRALTRGWPETIELHRIGVPEVRKYLTHRRDTDGVSNTTLRSEAGLLKRMFKAARAELKRRAGAGAKPAQLLDDPFDDEEGVKLPKARSRRYDHLASEEVDNVLSRIRTAAERHPAWAWDADLIEFAFLSGMRSAEIARVHVDHVEPFKAQLSVIGKNDDRKLYLADRAKGILARLVSAAGTDGFLVASEKGTERHRAAIVSAVFTRWKKRLGLKVRGAMHVMRHSFATEAANRGVPILDLKEAGGWKTLKMVGHYYHASPSRLRAVADAVANKTQFQKPPEGSATEPVNGERANGANPGEAM